MDSNSFKQNKWVRRAAWLVGSWLVLWMLSWALVPPLLKHQLQKMASEELGRTVTVGQIDFKPWTLELALTDLSVAHASDPSPQLKVNRIYVNAELQSILRLAPVIDAFQIDGLSVKLAHLGNGNYDVDDMLARLSRPSERPASGPPQFAVFNIAVNGGTLDFRDDAVGKTHEMRDLSLAIPFLSNFDAQRDVKTSPRLAFTLNGSRFDSAAESTPFAQSSRTDASVRFSGLDLKPYLGYLPSGLPIRLQEAKVDADVKVSFEQKGKTALKVGGVVAVTGVKAADSHGQDLFSVESFKVVLDDVRPLEQSVKLGDIELSNPRINIVRDKGGLFNFLASASRSVPAITTEKIAKESTATGTSGTNNEKKSAWKLEVAKIAVQGGSVNFDDESTTPKAQLALNGVAVQALAIGWPFQQPMQIEGAASLSGKGATESGAAFSFKGTATDQAANADLTVKEVPLALASPYLAQFLKPGLTGALSAQAVVTWKDSKPSGGKADGQAGVQMLVKQLSLDNLALAASGPHSVPLASLKRLEVADTQIDLQQQTIAVGKLKLTQPIAHIERDQDKHWMYEAWLKPQAPAGKDSGKPWTLSLADMALEGGAVQFMDKVPAEPVAFEVSAIKVQVKKFALDAKTPFPLTVSARIRSAQGEPGQLDYTGNLGLSPLAAQGRVVATQIPVHLFEPYFANAVNVKLLRADAGFKGDVSFSQANAAGPHIKLNGDVVLEEFKANSLVGASAKSGGSASQDQEELLAWKALGLRGLDVSLAPGSAPRISVRETALTDFFARITINPKGQINLQNLGKPEEAPAVATNSVANNSTPSGTSGSKLPESPALVAAALPSASTSPVDPLAPVINVGPISLVNGRVFFSDYFVKPNYSANLSELTGKLGAFSSNPGASTVQMADLELRGRAEGTASLEILGKLNPLAKPLALDIKAKVRDLELPPLSPYSVKYAGYGIERGKLSVDVAYLVKPDGQLEASNNIILNQLTFGEKVEGAENSLPVKLAVALLSDRNGVIDINLPVSGSLNDPQFRLGPIIFKVIVNLIVKAITAPFSLLASAFGGGGNELSMVGFDPGSSLLSAQATAGLDKVAKALADRPALKLTVVGTARLEVEREAYKRARLDAMMAAEKRRVAVAAGSNANAGATVTVSAAERTALLKEVYKRADITKPRNLVGMAKDIPQADMEALLLASIKVNDEVMHELAVQRGVAVKDYLATKQLPPERLFMGAVKSGNVGPNEKAVADTKGDGAKDTPEATWTPRAELNLATN